MFRQLSPCLVLLLMQQQLFRTKATYAIIDKICQKISLRRHEGSKPGHFVKEEEMLHPAVQIYIWCLLTLAAQMLGGQLLLLLAGATILASLRMCGAMFLFLLRRTRWILLSVSIIYMYTSPGEALWPQLGVVSPVVEGIWDGLSQLLRLATVLAGLSILLTSLSQSQLIAGLYTLSRPLVFLGLPRERVAVRLALTLRYAERAMQDTASSWRGSFEYLLAPMPALPELIELHVARLSRCDWMLVAAPAALLGAWLVGGVWL